MSARRDRVSLFLTDLDGTLLDPSGRVSPRSAALLTPLLEAGHAITAATARSASTARAALGPLPLATPLIVSNGAFVVPADGGPPLRRALIAARDLGLLLAASRALALCAVVLWTDRHTERISWRPVELTSEARTFLDERSGDGRLAPVDDWSRIDATAAFLATVRGPSEAVDALDAALAGSRTVRALADLAGAPGAAVLDVTGADASKGHAARWLAAHLGLERIVAFGDGMNDLPVFAVADESYAVAGAPDAVRRAATGVIGSNRDDAVARFLAARLA